MKKALLFAAVATVTLAGSAQAQICAGFPSSERGFYFGGRADFPDGLDSFGAEANYNASGPLGVYGGINVISVDGSENSDVNQFFVGAAFDVAALGAMIGPQVSVCPNVEVQFSDEDDSGQIIPIGLGFGGSLGVPGLSVQPYVNPQLVIFNFDGDTETEFGARAGVMVGVGLFSVGGEVRHYFVDGADPTFGIRVGVAL
jgi:hypothetical protein